MCTKKNWVNRHYTLFVVVWTEYTTSTGKDHFDQNFSSIYVLNNIVESKEDTTMFTCYFQILLLLIIQQRTKNKNKKKTIHVLKGCVPFATAQLLPPPIGSALFQQTTTTHLVPTVSIVHFWGHLGCWVNTHQQRTRKNKIIHDKHNIIKAKQILHFQLCKIIRRAPHHHHPIGYVKVLSLYISLFAICIPFSFSTSFEYTMCTPIDSNNHLVSRFSSGTDGGEGLKER